MADVARSHGGDGNNDPPPGPSRLPAHCEKSAKKSISKRKRSIPKRKDSRNIGLGKLLSQNGNKKLDIKFEKIGQTFNVVGPYASKFSRAIGNALGSKIPLGYASWYKCPEEHRARVIPELEEFFNLDPHKIDREHWEMVQSTVDHMAASMYSNRKYRKKQDYINAKEGKKPNKPPNLNLDVADFERCTQMWEDPDYIALGQQNSINRLKQTTVSLHGSASIAQHMHKKCDPDTGELPSMIDTYGELHRWTDERGWVSDKARINYEKMTMHREESFQSQPTEFDPNSSLKLTTDEEIAITERVLGTRSAYQRGVGRKNRKLVGAQKSTQPSSSSRPSTGVSRQEMESFVSSAFSSAFVQYQESIKQWYEMIAQQSIEQGRPLPPPPPPAPFIPPTRPPSPPTHHDDDNAEN